jgi:type III restriction enzyme
MRLKFKQQGFQTDAVMAVADCFSGQPLHAGVRYRVDPGRSDDAYGQARIDAEMAGFRNSEFAIPASEILRNVQAVQQRQGLPLSAELKAAPGCAVNLDVEMETGTGKTYCYIKTMFELNKRFGWSKFIVVVPSIAIREGVHKSLKITAEHFLETYKKRARFFIYNSKQLHNLESFSSDAGVNVMIINVQAFNARGQDARRIYEELDDFQSRKPIDVIAANRPILILDEPQKMEGAKTVDALKSFTPLMILRYSATHKQEFNKIYRLDALDAYNQKLVKKIGVRGISVKGLGGTNPYLYLDSILISKGEPRARIEFAVQQKNGIKNVARLCEKGDNLHVLSGELDVYKGFVVSDMSALDDTVSFTNGVVIRAGEATGDVNETALRRIQIREAVRAHFEKEQTLFSQGIKVLSLFFIDEVAKYRKYEGGAEQAGEYAVMFEEEYREQLNEVLTLEDSAYNRYLRGIATGATHTGYFSIDKKSRRMVASDADSKTGESSDVDAYDLILKNKEQLLKFEEPVRFIFSHSALREGWDNPNVFVICTLKHTDNTTTRRQEVGRGLRLCVNQLGDRMDDPATVHATNVLTVIASESYKDFVAGLQKDIVATLAARPQKADKAYFTGKVLQTAFGEFKIDARMAGAVYQYLVKNDYVDLDDKITMAYVTASAAGALAPLPVEAAKFAEQVFPLIDAVFTEGKIPLPEDERKAKENLLNDNFRKKEFQELWSRINRKAVYSVHFETDELVQKCVAALDAQLKVTPLQYTVASGEQRDEVSYEALQKREAFELAETATKKLRVSARSVVKYDLIGKVAEETKLTRSTVGRILAGMNGAVFSQYRTNPEDFMRKAAQFVNEQKATVIVEHLAYNTVAETYSEEIFTQAKSREDFSKAFKAKRHVWDYVFTDSQTERKFVEELDSGTDVVVYAKLPRTFFIPTPVGNYSPDWAIAFQQGAVKHVYFVAETKGSMSTMDLKEIEQGKIKCARKFFAKITSEQVRYEVVKDYGTLMELVK